ncbi:unnamed protein product [Sphagnum jensenii]
MAPNFFVDDKNNIQHRALEQFPHLAYCLDDDPPWVQQYILGFQHYLTMLGTTVLIPILVFRSIGVETLCTMSLQNDLALVVQSALFVSAINTMLQTNLGSRLPAVMGNSFYFLSITLSIVNAPSIVDIPDLHEVRDITQNLLEQAMRAIQGAFIAGSALTIILGFSGLWGQIVRVISPVVIAPVTAIVGFGLLEHGFPGIANCVQIGIPALLFILLFSQYWRHIHIRYVHVFELFPIIFGVVIVWVCATILTVTGAYDHASALGQLHCRTDQSGLDSHAPWVRISYPLQWGPPTFDAGNAFGVMSAAFAALIESTGGFYALARLTGATPPPISVISRGIGWQGIGLFLNGIFGTFTGATVAPENIGLIGITRVGSRRVVQIAAIFMFFFSIFGKFGGILAAIPQPIVAAILCVTFGTVGTGLSMLQFINLNFIRNLFVVGFSIFLGLSVPQYFSESTSRAYDFPVHTHFNNILGSPIIITFLVACVLDNTLTWHISNKDRGLYYTRKFNWFEDPRSFEFYSLPFGLEEIFPPDSSKIAHEFRDHKS